jgi:Alpha/beta hydrolase family
MSELHPISAGGGTPQADVIFVHGLDGHPFKTWQHDPNRQTDCWLHWLSEDASAVAVHTLEYAARSSAWLGQAMPLVDRAKEVLNELTRRGIGNRPIILVCHSLGGLLAKQLLRTASDDAAPPAWRKIADQTKGNAWAAALGETRRAIELYEQRLAITREIGDRMGEGNALFNSRALRSMRLASGTRQCGGCARRSPSTMRSERAIWSSRRVRNWPLGVRQTTTREAA